MSITVRGLDRLSARWNGITDLVEASLDSEITDVANDVLDESQALAPYLTGDLRDSAFLKSSRKRGGVEVTFGYEGLPYILVQHEGGWNDLVAWGVHYGPTKIRNYTTPGTGKKFLERPWAASLPATKKRLQDATKRAISG